MQKCQKTKNNNHFEIIDKLINQNDFANTIDAKYLQKYDILTNNQIDFSKSQFLNMKSIVKGKSQGRNRRYNKK